MNPSDFERYRAKGFSRIPLSCELVADLDNPLSVFMKLADEPYTFLFESVQGGEKWGRYSIIGLPASKVIRIRAKNISISEDDVELENFDVEDPLQWIEQYQAQFRVPDISGLPRITGGLVGYFGYDTVRYVEPRLGPNPHPDPIGNPDILLMVTDELVIFDNLSGKLTVIVLVDPSKPDARLQGLRRVADLHKRLRAPLPVKTATHTNSAVSEDDFESGFTQTGFKAAVKRIIEYITQGECMQVVLSQRLVVPYEAPPLDLYRALRTLNPSPYMFYLDLGDHHVVGASPEILVRLEEGEVTVRPLAGTRPRGASDDEDRANETSLLADPKELAEHLMLIDLGRNDIGRIAQTGSVKVTDQFNIERYSHVMHIVSNVVGKLKQGMSPMDVLRATFPAGTLSGAPKVRAMEIIQELEPVKRGVYSGAVGYLSWNGNMDTAIAIRTAVIKNGQLNVQAGAGIVYDSDPESEWQETHSKARAIFRAVSMAQAGLDAPPAMFAELNQQPDITSDEGFTDEHGGV
ncbi:MAG: anthranilate synthase component I [Granulosicoccus sp.]